MNILMLFYCFFKYFYIILFFILGTRLVPCDFIAPIKSLNPIRQNLHHDVRTDTFRRFYNFIKIHHAISLFIQ